MKIIFVVLILSTTTLSHAGQIDMQKISQIESSGNPLAHNKRSNARGLYQITPICLKEYNNFHKSKQYTLDDLWNASVSTEIADWYLNNRIPKMLKHFRKPVTDENILISYNCGIACVDKPLPKETRDYIAKYRRIK